MAEPKTAWLNAYCHVCQHTIQALAYMPTKIGGLFCPACGRVCNVMPQSRHKLVGTKRAERVHTPPPEPKAVKGKP